MKITSLSDVFASLCFPPLEIYLDDMPKTARFERAGKCGSAIFAAAAYRKTNRTILILTQNTKRAEEIIDNCAALTGDDDAAMLFPSRDAVPYNMKSPFGPTTESRFRVLQKLLQGEKKIIAAPSAALLQKTASGRKLFNSTIRLETGTDLSIEEIAKWLTACGFRRENRTDDIGTFSIRGGILDVYPFLLDNPCRLEFWGDTIESIRSFDVFTQKSLSTIKSIDILPMREFCFDEEMIDAAIEKMFDSGLDKSAIHKLEHQWKTTGDISGIEWFLHWFEMQTESILDYLPNNAIVVWDDVVPVNARLDEARANYENHLSGVPEIFTPLVSTPDKLLINNDDILESLDCYNKIFIDTMDVKDDAEENAKVYKLSISELPPLQIEMAAITREIETQIEHGYRPVIACNSSGNAQRMIELFGDLAARITFCTPSMHGGFMSGDLKLLLYTESQILNRPYTRKISESKKQKSKMPLGSFEELAPQDIVVHEEHGIGRFVGVERITAGDTVSDCMVILYADRAKVSVPIEDFHKVQKYIGKEGAAIALSKIGTSQWEKLKQRTRESLREMAQELIDLYAKRKHLEGISFDKDSVWQREFEESFIYDETPDQLRAIKEVKEDMESNKPMDRLVCGDVGFGKTEVAMRAAFKAVMSGYQVALLAPTTILAAQHFQTFKERMINFPVKIESVSRFKSAREQKNIREKVTSGDVDILIGTHRILSSDIKFKKLGLLIIDEEQRFGVMHKESLKKLRSDVDTLSMTATPIPRTLHMSLVGARDLSIINTPPQNRLPIETKVAEYHDELVKRAIENEIDRGGQVFFVNNRIKNIAAIQSRLEQLVPRAKTICAHGQMNESELEAVMKEFTAGRADILISTVIIENGIDIPNVNTIIVNRADTLGLSQLYQLRGRVGRSSNQAYAYFLTIPFAEIKDDSLKRLKAMEQYTDLGSGFQIAMRDLEIRGAGNILGTRQHGFIAAVGFELYCRLLQDAVDELSGNATHKNTLPQTRLEIPLQAYIPTEYIADGKTRISVYQEMSSLQTVDELTEMERSLADRFGAMPQCVSALVVLMKLKILGHNLGISKIAITKDGALDLYMDNKTEDGAKANIKRIFDAAANYQFEISCEETIKLRTKLTSREITHLAKEAIEILDGVISND